MSRGTLITVVSCFPAVLLIVPARSARNFKAFPQLARSGTPRPLFFSTLCFSPSFSFTPSFVFPNTEGLNETFHRPRGACFLRRETRRKRSQPGEDKLDGAATWAALCLIFFIIISSPFPVLKSHISPLLMCH